LWNKFNNQQKANSLKPIADSYFEYHATEFQRLNYIRERRLYSHQ
jgi:hypothetical protein